MICPRCRNSQTDDLTHCEACGNHMEPEVPAPAAKPAQEPGAFAAQFYRVVNSPLFLVGVILLSVPSLYKSIPAFISSVRALLYVSFSPFYLDMLSGFMSLMPTLLVIALWVIVFAAKTGKPRATLGLGLSLLSLYAILQLVFLGLMDLISAWLWIDTWSTSPIYVPMFIRSILSQILYIFIIASLLRVLKRLRRGVLSDEMRPLIGVKFFSVLSYIVAGVTVLYTLASVVYFGFFVGGKMTQDNYQLLILLDLVLPPQLEEVLYTLMYYGGLVCLIASLRRFQTLLALPIACEPSGEAL